MPNNPLQTFRAVEPANWGFGATATLASQPFVLGHFTGTELTAGPYATDTAFTWPSTFHNSNRFIPWLSRDFDNSLTTGAYYPVKVPHAYDRIYIFPMYRIFTSAPATISFNTSVLTYVPPFVFPMGLCPQTRGFTTVNKLNPLMYRFPDDIPPTTANRTRTTGYDIRTHGLWHPLTPYASNAQTSNGTMGVAASNDARTFGRTTVGTGTGYHLPADFSISKAAAAGLTAASGAPFASTSAADGTTDVLIGMGLDFQTMGCEEIVCALGSIPTGPYFRSTAAGGVAQACELFLMGMFLG